MLLFEMFRLFFFKLYAVIDLHFTKPANDHLCKELDCLCHMSTTIKVCSEHIFCTKKLFGFSLESCNCMVLLETFVSSCSNILNYYYYYYYYYFENMNSPSRRAEVSPFGKAAFIPYCSEPLKHLHCEFQFQRGNRCTSACLRCVGESLAMTQSALPITITNF